MPKRIRSWFAKHWRVFGQKPTNGKKTMAEMDGLLIEMASLRRQIGTAVESARADAAEIKEIYKEANAVTHTEP